MIDGPGVQVSATRSARWEVTSSPIDKRTRSDLDVSLRSLSRLASGTDAISLSIESLPPPHIGLGTKTALILAALVAGQIELGIALDPMDLMLASGRGGTSGIGIHGFFRGGFLVDAGHPQDEVPILNPSSSRRPSRPPMLVNTVAIPDRWRFHLLLPRGTKREGARERQFFRDTTPIPHHEVHQSISTVYHALVPAIIDGDLHHLKEALGKLHRVGFKARELAGQTVEVRAAYRHLLEECAVPVGLSSMGPILYVVLDVTDDSGAQAVARFSEDTGAAHLGAFAGVSQGYTCL